MTDFLEGPFQTAEVPGDLSTADTGIIAQLDIDSGITSPTPTTSDNFFNNDTDSTRTVNFLKSNSNTQIDNIYEYYDGNFIYDKEELSHEYKTIFKNTTFGKIIPTMNNNLDFNFLLHNDFCELMFYLDFKLQFVAQLNMYYNTYYEFNRTTESPLYDTTFIYNSRFRMFTDSDQGVDLFKPIDLRNGSKVVFKFNLTRVSGSGVNASIFTFPTSAANISDLEIDIKDITVTSEDITKLKTKFLTVINTTYNADMSKLKLKLANSSNGITSSGFKCDTYVIEQYNYLLITSFIFYEIMFEFFTMYGPGGSDGATDNEEEDVNSNKIYDYIEKFNKVLNNNILSLTKQKDFISNKNDIKAKREASTPFGTTKHNIFSAQKISNDLQNSNINIEENIEKVNKKNEEIKIKQKKLDNLQIISIVTIVLFVITILLLLFINKIKEYNTFSIFIYIYTILLLIYSVFICFYYLKDFNNIERFITVRLADITELKTKYLEILTKLVTIKDIVTIVSANNYCNNISLDFSDIINPLLKNEKKKYDKSEQNSELKEKITKFNYNITNRDVQYNLKMIEFMIRLLILMIVTLLLIYKFDNYIIIIGIISTSIFIVLLVIYFIEIIRLVRTNSKTYYWNKPVKEKEIII